MPPHAAYVKAKQVAKKFLRRKGVVGLGIGLRRKAGSQTKQRAIVVFVDHKLLPDDVRRMKRTFLPESLSVRVGARTYEIPLDVQGTGGQTVGKCQRLVCRQVHKQQKHKGAVGAIVQWNAQEFILTAGHVAVFENARCQVVGADRVIDADVEKVWMGSSLDYALLRPLSSLPPNAARLPNGLALTGVRPVTPSLIDTPAAFRSASTMRQSSVRILQVGAAVPFQPPGMSAPQIFRRLIGTEMKTVGGDSGTLLYDPESLAAIGTLIGTFAGYSYFLPCAFNFAQLDISLVT